MKLKAGYYFFQSQDGGQVPGSQHSGGYVLIRFVKNQIKIQCIAEHLSVDCGVSLSLCLWDSLNIEKPFVLGKMFLRRTGNELRGNLDITFRAGGLPPVLQFDSFALLKNDGKTILHTPPENEDTIKVVDPRPAFDPFKTTNPAYSWDRVETLDELKNTLLQKKITPLPEIAQEIKEALPKYRHILTGMYKPLNMSKNYYIIGVPGVRPPSGEEHVYRWINKCISVEEYPYFDGYKLYYFDGESGAIVKAVLRT